MRHVAPMACLVLLVTTGCAGATTVGFEAEAGLRGARASIVLADASHEAAAPLEIPAVEPVEASLTAPAVVLEPLSLRPFEPAFEILAALAAVELPRVRVPARDPVDPERFFTPADPCGSDPLCPANFLRQARAWTGAAGALWDHLAPLLPRPAAEALPPRPVEEADDVSDCLARTSYFIDAGRWTRCGLDNARAAADNYHERVPRPQLAAPPIQRETSVRIEPPPVGGVEIRVGTGPIALPEPPAPLGAPVRLEGEVRLPEPGVDPGASPEGTHAPSLDRAQPRPDEDAPARLPGAPSLAPGFANVRATAPAPELPAPRAATGRSEAIDPSRVTPERASPLSLALAAALALPLLAIALYSRIARDRMLAQPLRGRLYDRVRAAPGTTAAALAREFSVDLTTARYHLVRLEREGLLRSQLAGRSIYWFPPEARVDVAAADATSAETARRIARLVGERPGSTTTEIARTAGLRVDLTHYHLHRMARAGLVARSEGKRRAAWVLSGGQDVSCAIAQ